MLLGMVGCGSPEVDLPPAAPLVPLGAYLSVGSPEPDDRLRFGAALVAADLDGDGADEVLAGSDDSREAGGEPYTTDFESDRGQAWVLAGPSLAPVQGWSGNPEFLQGQLGLAVAVGAVLGDGAALVLWSGEAIHVLPTDPLPDRLDAPEVVSLGRGFLHGHQLAVGDLVGEDGIEDLVVPTYEDEGNTYEVQVLAGPLDDGSADSPAVVFPAPDVGGVWGTATADLDGDGAADLATGRWADAERGGEVRVYLGPLAGLPDAAASWSGDAGDHLGEDLLDVGDLDGDGLDELGIGAWEWPDGDRTGRFYAVRLDTPDLGSAALTLDGDGPDDWFGYSAAGGDADGDGQGDLAVSAPGTRYRDRAGRISLFLGPLSGAAVRPDRIWVAEPRDGAGRELAFADLDGDGADELVIAAPFSDVDALESGRLYVVAP